MSVAIILGTRPEIIKMSPIIREYERRGDGYFILHTGQHYSYSMDRIFFERLTSLTHGTTSASAQVCRGNRRERCSNR
jgi:UDP-N-acetylglucosamine 2-epimerase